MMYGTHSKQSADQSINQSLSHWTQYINDNSNQQIYAHTNTYIMYMYIDSAQKITQVYV